MAPRTLCLLLLLLSPTARAIDSLDWLIADSDLVIRGRVIMVAEKTTPTTGHYDWEEATITVYETLKGPAPKFDQIKVLRPTSQFKTAPWSEDPSIFLLVEGRRAAYLRSPDFLEGRYLMLDPHARIISLQPFALQRRDNSARDRVSMYAYVNPLYTAVGKRLLDPDEILDSARAITINQHGGARRPRPALVNTSEAGVIVVPADKNWQRHVEAELAKGKALPWMLELIQNPNNGRALMGNEIFPVVREGPELLLRNAAGKFTEPPRDYFRNEGTVEFLYRARDDGWGLPRVTNSNHWVTPLDQFETRDHLNRMMAYEVLRDWNLSAAGPPFHTPLLARHEIPLARPCIWIAMILLVFPIISARRQQLFFRCMTWFCLVMAIASSALWIRSASAYDSVVFATASFEHEISSSYGRLHYLVLSNAPSAAQPTPRPPSHGSVSLVDVQQVPHHLNYLRPSHEWAHSGIALAEGFSPPAVGFSYPSGATVSYAYQQLTIRYPWLIAFFLLLPAVRVLNALRRARRSRRRTRNLRCPACNYDLRHRPRRCPECGLPTPAFIHEPAGDKIPSH